MREEPQDFFPDPGQREDQIAFYDQDYSYKIFCLLEGNADGWGGWKITDTLGIPWVDLPEQLQADLMTWRWLNGIGERIMAKRRKEKDNGG